MVQEWSKGSNRSDVVELRVDLQQYSDSLEQRCTEGEEQAGAGGVGVRTVLVVAGVGVEKGEKVEVCEKEDECEVNKIVLWYMI